jgi:hypothetical protein
VLNWFVCLYNSHKTQETLLYVMKIWSARICLNAHCAKYFLRTVPLSLLVHAVNEAILYLPFGREQTECCSLNTSFVTSEHLMLCADMHFVSISPSYVSGPAVGSICKVKTEVSL